MERFRRFNRPRIEDRQIDTLIGLSKGLTANGRIDQAEAEMLMTWLVQSRQSTNNPIIVNLFEKLGLMLQDSLLDADESVELFELLRKIAGDPAELGELAKTASLPIDLPLPHVTFQGRSFLFTGTCAFGTRKQCEQAIEFLGGINAKSVTKSLNYLVLGSYVTSSWIHETFGRKIEKAMEYRRQGIPIAIITEEHWAHAGNLTVPF